MFQQTSSYIREVLPFSSSSSSKLDQFGRFKSSPEKTTPINYGPSPPAGRIKIISLSAGFPPALPSLCRSLPNRSLRKVNIIHAPEWSEKLFLSTKIVFYSRAPAPRNSCLHRIGVLVPVVDKRLGGATTAPVRVVSLIGFTPDL